MPECAWHAEMPPLRVDLGEHLRAGAHAGRASDLDGVRDQALDRALDVEDLQVRAVGGDDALVGDLAAGLGVERRAVEHDLAALARLELLDPLAVDDQAEDVRLAGELGVGPEVGRAERSQVCVQTSVLACPAFLAFASALARSRCSCISARNPSRSTSRPCSAAISRVRSIGKP